MPLYAERFHAEHGIPEQWAETNMSVTQPGVIRGLHYQEPEPQEKLITVVSGDIFDVIIDLRIDSPTYGMMDYFDLSSERDDCPNQVYLPKGLAHGFATREREAMIIYQVSCPWKPEFEKVIRWDDERYAIPWPIDDPVLSEKDQKG